MERIINQNRHGNGSEENIMKLYIYSTETMELVATSEGKTNEECEYKAASYLGSPGEYAGTYSPAFGCVDGVIDQLEIEEL